MKKIILIPLALLFVWGPLVAFVFKYGILVFAAVFVPGIILPPLRLIADPILTLFGWYALITYIYNFLG